MNDTMNKDVISNNSFWMVYVDYVDSAELMPIRHELKMTAIDEAERLALKTKKTVYLMQAVEGYKLQEMPVVKFKLG